MTLLISKHNINENLLNVKCKKCPGENGRKRSGFETGDAH
jgi:hypothetical protein